MSQSVPQNEPEIDTIELRILESRNFFEENCTVKALYGKEKYIFKSKVIEGTQECLVVSVPMKQPAPRELIIEVTDAERSRHEFNGKICIDTEQLIENGRLEDIWAPLENCDAGEMLIAAEVFTRSSESVLLRPRLPDTMETETQHSASKASEKNLTSSFGGGVSKVSLVKAKDLSKKDIFSKSDPYAVITFGSSKLKTETIKNSHEPEWNFEFDIGWEEANGRGGL